MFARALGRGACVRPFVQKIAKPNAWMHPQAVKVIKQIETDLNQRASKGLPTDAEAMMQIVASEMPRIDVAAQNDLHSALAPQLRQHPVLHVTQLTRLWVCVDHYACIKGDSDGPEE